MTRFFLSFFVSARRYFKSGADKISIGSEAVYAAEAYWHKRQQLAQEGRGGEPVPLDGTSLIEQISQKYARARTLSLSLSLSLSLFIFR